MNTNPDQAEAPASKPGAKPEPKDELKALPTLEVEKKLAIQNWQRAVGKIQGNGTKVEPK